MNAQQKNNLLEIKNLTVSSAGKTILKGLDIGIPAGQIHVLMGPNGSGKSTLSKTIMGADDVEIIKGRIYFKSKRINELSPEERAHLGIFLANQYPVEVPGVNLSNFLRIAYNSRFTDKKKHMSPLKFRSFLEEKSKLIDLSIEFSKRNLNEGFSGGEKKKCEILQMAVLEPKLAILDETDSGLDVDALKTVFMAVNKIKSQNKAMSLLIITHYERIFNYIKPDKIHILQDGKIIKTGNRELLKSIQKFGFKKFSK